MSTFFPSPPSLSFLPQLLFFLLFLLFVVLLPPRPWPLSPTFIPLSTRLLYSYSVHFPSYSLPISTLFRPFSVLFPAFFNSSLSNPTPHLPKKVFVSPPSPAIDSVFAVHPCLVWLSGLNRSKEFLYDALLNLFNCVRFFIRLLVRPSVEQRGGRSDEDKGATSKKEWRGGRCNEEK